MSSAAEGRAPRAVVFGCAGAELAEAERAFFAEADPLGFILFRRNCVTPAQVGRLVRQLREAVGRRDAPVLIDQEGGRVARLSPPHWQARPPARAFGRIAERDGIAAATAAARQNARLIAADLAALGITVDCLPVLDVPVAGAHDVIGDRAFAADPEIVAELGRAVCEGLIEGGVMPVIKHVPGHGRAAADSHRALPVVDAPLSALAASDFVPFARLNDMPWAMTAHVLYTAIDAEAPATVSRRVIEDVIRGTIGFTGLLISDDLCMQALTGDPADRAAAALAAGCDVALHCNGVLDDMRRTADGAGPLTPAAVARWQRAAALAPAAEPVDAAALGAAVERALAGL